VHCVIDSAGVVPFTGEERVVTLLLDVSGRLTKDGGRLLGFLFFTRLSQGWSLLLGHLRDRGIIALRDLHNLLGN